MYLIDVGYFMVIIRGSSNDLSSKMETNTAIWSEGVYFTSPVQSIGKYNNYCLSVLHGDLS